MLVQIIKSNRDTYWYSKLIGKILNVKTYKNKFSCTDIDDLPENLKGDAGGVGNFLLDIDDVKILEP